MFWLILITTVLVIWNLGSGPISKLCPFEENNDESNIAFSHDGKYLAGTNGKYLILRDIKAKTLQKIESNFLVPKDISFCENNRYVYLLYDTELMRADITSNNSTSVSNGNYASKRHMTPNGNMHLGSDRPSIGGFIFDDVVGVYRCDLRTNRYSPDGNYILSYFVNPDSVPEAGTVHLRYAGSGDIISAYECSFTDLESQVYAQFGADSRHFAIYHDSVIDIYKIDPYGSSEPSDEGRIIVPLFFSLSENCISAKGNYVAYRKDESGTYVIADVRSGKTIKEHQGRVLFSPVDDKLYALIYNHATYLKELP